MNKHTWRQLISTVLILAVLTGWFFFSYDLVENNFRGDYFLFYLVACLVIFPTATLVYWFIKRRGETLKPRRFQEVYIDRARDLVSDKEKVLNQYVKDITELGGEIIEINLDQIPRVIFYFSKEHKYNVFQRTSIKIHSVDVISIDTMMLLDYPLAFSIKRPTGKNKNITKKMNLPSSSVLFSYHTTDDLYLAALLARDGINELLNGMKDSLMLFAMNRKFVEVRFRKIDSIKSYLDLLNMVHEEILLKEFDVSDVEEILCYQCNDVFESNEEICDKCGAHRPNCKVCLLDLQPSEKEEVVISPCCNTYFHREHLITWLEQNATCPFCKNDSFLWLRGLKQDKKKK